MLIMNKAKFTLSAMSLSIYISLKHWLGKISCCVPKMPVHYRDKVSSKVKSSQHTVIPLKFVSLPI